MATEVHTDVNTDKIVGWCNSYTTPARPPLYGDALYGPDPYDVNFCFPYLEAPMCTDDVKVVPFIPRLHAKAFFMHAIQNPEDFQYMRFPVPKTFEEMLAWFEYNYRQNPNNMAYSVLFNDGKGNWQFGAFQTLIKANPDTLTAEIAMGTTFRDFRGEGRALKAASLIIRYCLSAPTDPVPGLGMRKLGWTAHSFNYPAQAIARSLGFRVESMQRWNRVATNGKKGNTRKLPESDPLGLPGIDDYYLVLGWDDYGQDGKPLCDQILTRKSSPVTAKM